MHGGRECVIDTSIDSLRLISSKVPNTVQKGQRKDGATQKLIGREKRAEKQQYKTIPQTKAMNRICRDVSALHSISFLDTTIPARREKAQDDLLARKKARQYSIIINR